MSVTAQYAIDVAVALGGGDQTAAQLDEVAAKFNGLGKGASVFTDALAQVSSQMTAARARTTSANDALATANAEYDALQKAAIKAAGALEAATLKAGDVGALRAAATSSAQAVADAATKLDALKVAAKDAAAAVKAGGGDYAKLRAEADAANAALALGKSEFGALSREAKAAAKALEGAVEAESRLPELARNLETARGKTDAFAKTLSKLEDEASAASEAEKRLATASGNLRKISGVVDRGLAGNVEKISKLNSAVGAVGGPLGRFGQMLLGPTQGFADLSGAIGKSRAIMVVAGVAAVAFAAAIAAVAIAAIAGVVAVAKWAVTLGDAARNANLAREAAEALDPSLVGVRSTIASLSRDFSLGEDALRGYAKKLQDARVSAEEMPAALAAVAIAEEALGQGGGDKFIADLQKSRKNVTALSLEMSAKLGGLASRKLLSLDAQTKRFGRNIGEVFGGLNIEPALRGLETLVGLFDKTEASGRAISLLFGKVFEPLIGQAQNAAFVIEAFALGFLIGLTKLYISLKPTIAAIGELFGFDTTSLTDVLTSAKNAGELFAKVFVFAATVIGVLTVAVGAVVGAVVAWNMALAAAIVTIASFGASVLSGIVGAISKVISYLGSVNWGELGTQMMAGLANGIMGSAGRVISAISGAVGGAIKQAKSLLGIASPSKVFAEIGSYTGEGFVGGVEDQTTAAQNAMADMVAPPGVGGIGAPAGATTTPQSAMQYAAAAVPSPGGGGGSSTSNTTNNTSTTGAKLDLHGATFNFYGVADAKGAERSIGEMLTRLLEGDAAQLEGSAA